MANLSYGSTYRIQNGAAGWNESYLDTRGQGCEDNFLCVSTATSFDRDSGSGSWIILSATGKNAGEPVLSGDLIYLQNQAGDEPYKGGYLDTRGYSSPNLLDVSTAISQDRDSGSGTWRMIKDSSGGSVEENDSVHLWNGWSDFGGGFLDTRGEGCQSNFNCVSTSASWDRDQGSTHWRFQKQ